MDDRVYLNALNRLPYLGPVRIGALVEHFGTARAAWEAPAGELAQVASLRGYSERVDSDRREIDPEAEWRRLEKCGARALCLEDREYPSLLKNIHRPPPLLYCRGAWQEDDHLALALVGSRRCTAYGREMARRLAGELAALGFTVVSGMALGIDTEAHRGALNSRGRTVAVLGCGVDICYPPGAAGLMEQIAAAGVVASEFPPGTAPLPQHFPQRNRIISGLSLGTLVVEAPAKSGALITAHYACEQNREVFAVPGSVNSPYSRGCHRLIKEGARLVETVEDILEELAVGPVAAPAAETAAAAALPPGEQQILDLVAYQPVQMDRLIRESGLPAEQVGSLLLSLELKGRLRQLPGKYFTRV